MEIVKPVKQKAWGKPAVINFIAGGSGAGLYIIGHIIDIFHGTSLVTDNPAVKLVAPLLVILGFIALITEAGRPMRAYLILNNVRSSWMSRESLAGAVFIVAAVIDYLIHSKMLQILAMFSAFMFIMSQGLILYRAIAVKSWNVPVIAVFILTSGLTMGLGLFFVFIPLGTFIGNQASIITGIFILVLDFAIWIIYVYSYVSKPSQGAVSNLLNHVQMTFTIGLGHIIPLFFIALLISDSINDMGMRNILHVVTGLSIIIGGIIKKVIVILSANELRSIVMDDHVMNINESTFNDLSC